MCHCHYYEWNCAHWEAIYWTHGTSDKCDGTEINCPDHHWKLFKFFDTQCGKLECAQKWLEFKSSWQQKDKK